MMRRCTYFAANNHGALPEYQAIYQNNTAITSSSKQLSKRKSKNGGHSALQGCFHSALFKHCAGAFVILFNPCLNTDWDSTLASTIQVTLY